MSVSKAVIFTNALLIALIVLFVPAFAQGPAASTAKADFVAGEILVKFKSNVRAQDTQRRLAGVRGAVIRSVPVLGTLQVKVPAGQELAAIAQLQARTDVEYAELNHTVHALGTPNDPSYGLQWGIPKINLPAAWDITKGAGTFIVAVVDTGVDLDHPDFSCTVPGGASKLTAGYDFYNNDSDPDDDNSHGSHVAGIVGACTDNSLGVAGTAPNVRIMPVKVLNSAGSGSYAAVASGIIYAANNGAKVINLSLGGTSNNITLSNAVQYAHSNGVLVVAAAGNFAHLGNPLVYPAAMSESFAVGATNSADNWPYFSEHHPYVDVSAPGVSIYSTWSVAGYGYKSGTSMATPYAAGLAALVWSAAPGLTQAEVRQVIEVTALDLGTPGKDDYYGYGRINALAAVERVAGLNLAEYTGEPISGPIVFLVDDTVEYPPPPRMLQINTISLESITWTVSVSPNVSWISVKPPSTGLVSAASLANFSLVATQPVTYGTFNTTLVVSGTNASSLEIGPITNSVSVIYVPKLTRFRFPLIFKN